MHQASLSSGWVCLSKNLVLQYILESLSSLLFHSLMSEWKLLTNFFAHCLPPHFSSRLFCPALFWLVGKRRDKNGQQKWSAIHSLISEWKRRDNKLSSIYWRTRFLLRHTQPDDRLACNQKVIKNVRGYEFVSHCQSFYKRRKNLDEVFCYRFLLQPKFELGNLFRKALYH